MPRERTDPMEGTVGMWSNVATTRQSDGSQSNGGKATRTASLDTLIRTLDGHITLWSPDMEQRYGFTNSEAIGSISHQLLRTLFPQALPEIEAKLVDHRAWSGVLIHRHADGRAVMTVNHWHLHEDSGSPACLITEVHSDIAEEDNGVCGQLADVIAVLAHEVSEPLTAISNYIDGAQRILQRGWPDLESVRAAMARTSDQIARGAEGVRLLRDLANSMRDTE